MRPIDIKKGPTSYFLLEWRAACGDATKAKRAKASGARLEKKLLHMGVHHNILWLVPLVYTREKMFFLNIVF